MCGNDDNADNVSRETWAHIQPAYPGYWVFFPAGVRWISDEEEARHIAAKLESGTPPEQCFT